MVTQVLGVYKRVNAIVPSLTSTDILDQVDETVRNELIDGAALQRPAEQGEVVNVGLFPANRLLSYVIGQVLRVDGGLT